MFYEFKKQILGDEKAITCRPADLIEPELEKNREAIKELMIQEEDVLTYALLPQVAEKFFRERQQSMQSGVTEPVAEVAVAQSETPVEATENQAVEVNDDEMVAVISAAIAAIESESGTKLAVNSIRQVSPWVLSARLKH